MTVLLVLFTFITFLLIDYFRTRNAAVHPVLETSSGRATASAGVSGRLRSPGKFAVSPRSHLGNQREPQPSARRHG